MPLTLHDSHILDRVMDLPCLSWHTNLEWVWMSNFVAFCSIAFKYLHGICIDDEIYVGWLLIAKLLTCKLVVNPLRLSIWLLQVLVVGSSLGRPRTLLLYCDKVKCVWIMWDWGIWCFKWLLIKTSKAAMQKVFWSYNWIHIYTWWTPERESENLPWLSWISGVAFSGM
jgi:hypothetical protein